MYIYVIMKAMCYILYNIYIYIYISKFAIVFETKV